LTHGCCSFSWLYGTPLKLGTKHLDLINLQKHLTPFLDVRLRNGKEAIMRFYDPRVLPTFFKLLSDEQIDKLMSHIQLWTYHDVKQNQYIAYQGVQQDGIK
jgi:hypothetical protein